MQRTGELRLCEKLRDFGWSNVATLDRADQQTRLAKTQEHAMRAKNGGGKECVIECNLPRVEIASRARATPIASRILRQRRLSDFPREQAVFTSRRYV